MLRGPEFFWTDLYLTKRFILTERLSMRLDGQFFNLLNHPNFALPAMIAGIPGKPDPGWIWRIDEYHLAANGPAGRRLGRR